jgi:transposase InsO family protein
MKGLSEVAGLSRQSYYQHRKRSAKTAMQDAVVLQMAHHVRADHPGMGCRKMHKLLRPAMGRDRFERLLLENGFRVKRVKNYQRTTYPSRVYFDNLIEGMLVKNINQLWQSDITYIKQGDRFYYLTFIIDVYSRRILGAQVSKHLMAIANVEALRQAIRLRGRSSFKGLIHHSDRGCQYMSKEYVAMLKRYNIQPSMCLSAWQNAFAERINGVIKNEYLLPWNSSNFEELKINLRKAVRLYNQHRPHWNLINAMSPIECEQALKHNSLVQQPIKIYTSKIEVNK